MRIVLSFLVLALFCCDKNYNVRIQGALEKHSSFENKKVTVNLKNATKTCEGVKFLARQERYSLSFSCLHTLPNEIGIYNELDTIILKIFEINGKIYVSQKGAAREVKFKKTRKVIIAEYDIM